MTSKQKNIRLSVHGWQLLADLSPQYKSEAQTIEAALEALKAMVGQPATVEQLRRVKLKYAESDADEQNEQHWTPVGENP